MAIAGYNTTGARLEVVTDIELGTDGRAMLYIDDGHTGSEVPLSYAEVCEMQAKLADIRADMEWNMATWLFADVPYSTKATHLMPKEKIERPKSELSREFQERAACGQTPPSFGWKLSPVVGGPHSDCCKRCLRAYGQTNERRVKS